MAIINGGSGNDGLGGTGGDDVINGLGGNDFLVDGTGNDKLDGGVGNDELDGGADNDTLIGAAGNDILLGGLGNDTLTGVAGNDTMFGGDGNDTLVGGAGNDRLEGDAGIDRMEGGAGNDFYRIDNVADSAIELVNGGVDFIVASVSMTLPANVELLELSGTDDIDGVGNELSNEIAGNGGDNKLDGGIGNDLLIGVGGADTMTGGVGNDTYVVDSLDDVIKEIAGQGKDTAIAEGDYVLAADADIETLKAAPFGVGRDLTGNGLANTVVGDTGDDTLDGAAGNDTLSGGDGADELDGGTGKDAMAGGKGNDAYKVDDAGDKLTEAANQGRDTVTSLIGSFTLGANFEDLTLGGGALNGAGNTLDNVMAGNELANKLDGGAGNDHLLGGEGDDTLLGGAGNDRLDGEDGKDSLSGGAGNDVYVLTDLLDTVVEAAAGGNDTIETDLDDLKLVAFANIENVTLTGNANLKASGDALANRLTGNDGKNTLTGDAGNDTLDGGAGADTLIGGIGGDTYIVDSALDSVQESAGQGKDTVLAANGFGLAVGQEIEVLTLTGTDDVFGIGNDFANTINGNAGANLLTGGGANDTLNGGAGDDILDGDAGDDVVSGGKGNDAYEVDSVLDKVIEAAGQGVDSVVSVLASYTLAANVENLALEGAAASGTGNTLNNQILGNALDNKLAGAGGNDTLDGGGGNDEMNGGAGNDFYVVEEEGDTIVEAANGGIDEVQSDIEFNLADFANVERLTLVGGADISGTGNDLANVIVGNPNANTLIGGKGNDTLDGGGKADILVGGVGDDTYFVDNVGDQVTETAGQGTDTVRSSVNFTINAAQSIEILILSADASLLGTGNDDANVMTMIGKGDALLFGNGGNDKLTGAGGNDQLEGGEGNDTVSAGAGDDNIHGGVGNDSLIGGDGNDRLDGFGGNDIMTGGKGDDVYIVAQSGDKVTEAAKQGHDRVESSLASFTLGANLEDLFLFDTGLKGVGNGLNNELRGSELGNTLDGGAGNDILRGRNGNDSLLGGAGNDEVTGEGDADTLRGGAGNDILDGGIGADVMFGEAGSDIFRYLIEDEGELASLGGDTINGYQAGVDRIDLSQLLDVFAVDPNGAFSGGFVLLTKSGADTLVQFDSDGSAGGAATPLTLATVTNATVAQSDLILA